MHTSGDYHGMTLCERAREHLSASLDGAVAPPGPEVAPHLETCAACASWLRAAAAVTRGLRVVPAEEVPDLTEPLLVAYRAAVAGARPAAGRGLRWVLAFVALAQLAIAVPGLVFGNDAGAPVHVAHELGSWDIALAVGFLYAARRPARAFGLLPLVGTLVGLLLVTSVLDLTGGRTATIAELPHALAVVGFCLLAALARPRLFLRTA
jgi:predicted anti-sigma-YlaC factor YlaD